MSNNNNDKFNEIYEKLQEYKAENYRDFIKALIKIEYPEIDESDLDMICYEYMETDNVKLLSEEIEKLACNSLGFEWEDA